MGDSEGSEVVDAAGGGRLPAAVVPPEMAEAAFAAWCARRGLNPEEVESCLAVSKRGGRATTLVVAGAGRQLAELMAQDEVSACLHAEVDAVLAGGEERHVRMVLEVLEGMISGRDRLAGERRDDAIRELRMWHEMGRRGLHRRRLLRERDRGVARAADALGDYGRELLRQRRGEGGE